MRVENANKLYKQLIKSSDITRLTILKPVISDNGFSVLLQEYINDNNNSFNLTVEGAEINEDLILIIIASLVLQKYKKIDIDFSVKYEVLEEMKYITGATIKSKGVLFESIQRPEQKNWSLNLSGGIDSITLKLLCPELIPIALLFTDLSPDQQVSEQNLKDFDITTIKTNAFEFLFARYSTGFYNLGSLMLANEKNIKYAINGKIMTDDYLRLYNKTVEQFPDIYGIKVLYPLLGFTKIGIYKLLYKLNKKTLDTINKRYHQKVKLKAAKLKHMICENMTNTKIDSISKDVQVSFDECPFYGVYLVKKGFFQDIPDELKESINDIDISFYSKYDKKYLEYLPEDFRNYFEKKLIDAGVEFYSDEDYAERDKVIAICMQFVKFEITG